MTSSRFSLTGFQLKLLALIFMVFDHVKTYFGHQLHWPLWFSWLGRFVAPVFLYLMLEGFYKTSNRQAYSRRLLSGALVMLVINLLHNLAAKSYLHPVTGEFDWTRLIMGYNIFWTLFLLFGLFTLLEKWQSKRTVLGVVQLVGLLPVILLSEGGLVLLPLALMFFFTKGQPKQAAIGLLVFSGLWLLKSIYGYVSRGHDYQNLYQHLTYDNQFMMFPAAFLIQAYNGQRGGTGASWEKHLFYLIYPIHLAVIYALDVLLGKS